MLIITLNLTAYSSTISMFNPPQVDVLEASLKQITERSHLKHSTVILLVQTKLEMPM